MYGKISSSGVIAGFYGYRNLILAVSCRGLALEKLVKPAADTADARLMKKKGQKTGLARLRAGLRRRLN